MCKYEATFLHLREQRTCFNNNDCHKFSGVIVMSGMDRMLLQEKFPGRNGIAESFWHQDDMWKNMLLLILTTSLFEEVLEIHCQKEKNVDFISGWLGGRLNK